MRGGGDRRDGGGHLFSDPIMKYIAVEGERQGTLTGRKCTSLKDRCLRHIISCIYSYSRITCNHYFVILSVCFT